jgi:uncharacterized protein (DUF2141 family)
MAVCALLLLAPIGFGQDNKGDIVVTVTGFRNATGKAKAALFCSAEGFPNDMDKAAAGVESLIVDNKAVLYFGNVPYGVYAVSILHDENDNNRMDTGLFGIPVEGYCFSNNAHGFLGPPSYTDAAISLKEKTLELNLTLGY